jgi:hypothetical protein
MPRRVIEDPYPDKSVLVCTPNYVNQFSAEVDQNRIECAVNWTLMGLNYKLLTIGRTFVHFARTQACQVSLLLNFTHILWLDDDAIIDPQLLPKYLEFDKEIIVTPYFMRRPPFECGVLKSTTGDFHDHRTYRNLTIEDLDQGLIEVDGGGTHAMLVKTSVLRTPGNNTTRDACDPKLKALLERLSPEDREVIDHNVGTLPDESFTMEQEDEQGIKPFFSMPKTGTEDMLFCYRAKRKGIKIWCDTDAQAGHVGFPPVVTKAFREQAEVMIATEKGETPKAVVHRIQPNDITAGTDALGVSSARHEALDMRKAASLI